MGKPMGFNTEEGKAKLEEFYTKVKQTYRKKDGSTLFDTPENI